MNKDILNLNAISLIGRFLQGYENIVIELKEALEIWTTSYAQMVNFNKQRNKKIKKLNKKPSVEF